MEKIGYEIIDGKRIAYVLHEAGNKKIVILAHGFRGNKTGPWRLFVQLARKLAENNISVLRFDQYGCGDSEGESTEMSFDDWVNKSIYFAEKYLKDGYEVAFVGQSMGASSSIVAASKLGDKIKSVVLWVPAMKNDVPESMKSGIKEEGGQLYDGEFMRQASDANIVECYKRTLAPVLVVATKIDEWITKEENNALFAAKQDKDTFDIKEDWSHGRWTYAQGEEVIDAAITFLIKNFE